MLVPVVEGERGATWSGSFLLDQGFVVGMECSVLSFTISGEKNRQRNKKKP